MDTITHYMELFTPINEYTIRQMTKVNQHSMAGQGRIQDFF